jgi:hypothetical protein
MSRRLRIPPVEAVVAALAGSLVGAALVSAHGDVNNLHYCHKPNAAGHLIATDVGETCATGEVLDEWTTQGPANDGVTGPRGLVGPQGDAGPTGRDGRAVPASSFSVVRRAVTFHAGSQTLAVSCAAGELAVAGGWASAPGVTVLASAASDPGTWTVRAVGAAAARPVAGSVSAVCAKPVTP